MVNVENLISIDAIEKMREISKAANICMFVTNLTSLPLSARPMATQQVDEEGNIWFMSGKDSDKNEHIAKEDAVQLFYSNTGGYEYMSVYGSASIVNDPAKVEELWTPMAKTWFEKGKDDPNLSLIKVVPQDAYYWDTKDNKLVSLFKFALSAIGIKTKDDGGVEGNLNP